MEGKHEGTVLTSPNDAHGAVFSPDNILVGGLRVAVASGYAGLPFRFFAWISGAFSPMGTTMLSASTMNDAKLWGVSSGQYASSVQLFRVGDIMATFTAHGGMALPTCRRCISLWNVETGARMWEYPLSCVFCTRRSADFSACGDWSFTIDNSGDVRTNATIVWRVAGCSHNCQLKEPTGEVHIEHSFHSGQHMDPSIALWTWAPRALDVLSHFILHVAAYTLLGQLNAMP